MQSGSDYDNDGWEDLVVARDWNTIVVVRNMQGKELVPEVISELDDLHGKWYSLAAGDFDGDGDTDLVAGNMGVNCPLSVPAGSIQ
jgi:enediyne biosynthesis protein E4